MYFFGLPVHSLHRLASLLTCPIRISPRTIEKNAKLESSSQSSRKSSSAPQPRPPTTPGGGRSDAVKELEEMIASEAGRDMTNHQSAFEPYPEARESWRRGKSEHRPQQSRRSEAVDRRGFSDLNAMLSNSIDSLGARSPSATMHILVHNPTGKYEPSSKHNCRTKHNFWEFSFPGLDLVRSLFSLSLPRARH